MKRFAVLALMAGGALALGGCTGGQPEGVPPSAPVQSTISPAPGIPATGGSASPVPASSTQNPTVLPTSASVTVFYIAVDDGGTSGATVGCGDSAVAVTSQAISFTDPVEAALRTLLANDSEEIGQSGLRNALWPSDLAVTSVDRSGSTVTAHLDGTLMLGGECDIPRVEQQLLHTAQRAAGVPVAITINGKTLSDALSLK